MKTNDPNYVIYTYTRELYMIKGAINIFLPQNAAKGYRNIWD